MVAVVQLAITLGAGVGGILFDSFGYQATFLASAALLIASAGAALLAARTASNAADPAASSHAAFAAH